MMRTLNMSGMLINNALTANLSPSFLEINLRGRNTLNNLKARNDFVWLESIRIETTENTTIMKSIISHMFRRYEFLPLQTKP